VLPGKEARQSLLRMRESFFFFLLLDGNWIAFPWCLRNVAWSSKGSWKEWSVGLWMTRLKGMESCSLLSCYSHFQNSISSPRTRSRLPNTWSSLCCYFFWNYDFHLLSLTCWLCITVCENIIFLILWWKCNDVQNAC
jgi:hypothetical protein